MATPRWSRPPRRPGCIWCRVAAAITAIERAGGLGDAKLVILCDVRTPFEDAARVFGPQKGADADQVRRLTARLNAQARRLPRDPRGEPMTGAAGGPPRGLGAGCGGHAARGPPRGEPMTGAAGGLSGGLWAACGAQLVSGSSFVLDEVGFDARMRAS